MKEEFTKEDTKLVKGFAIILMLMHHLWAFPSRIPTNSLIYVFTIFNQSSIQYIGWFGKICVSIFFFLGGYGTYISSRNKKTNILTKIKKLYISYWKVFLIFIPIAFLFFRNQIPYCRDRAIYSAYNNFNLKVIIYNFLGFSSSLNREWWFLLSYVYALLLFPIFKKIFENFSAVVNIMIVIILTILTYNIPTIIKTFPALLKLNTYYAFNSLFWSPILYISCFWMGMVFAKDNLIVKLKQGINKIIQLNCIYDVIIIAIIVLIRQKYTSIPLDIFLVPLLIVVVCDFIKTNEFIKKVFIKLGNQSTNMWFIHSFFCYYFYFFVKIVISPKGAILSLLLFIVITYIASVLLDLVWKGINYIRTTLI